MGHTTPRGPPVRHPPAWRDRKRHQHVRGPFRHRLPCRLPRDRPDGVDVFELGAEHEQVVFCNDHATGLKAIVAIHSTALGPGLGGTRFYPYATTADAIRDVLNLSRGMSYKAALAGLDLGGGKAVIIGDPMKDKTEALLRAYGRFVQAIGGRYYTACDVGTYSEDMDVVARECRSSPAAPSPTAAPATRRCSRRTASTRACAPAPRRCGARRRSRGRTVGVAGVGKVGHHLVKHLVDDGAQVVVTDVYQPAVDRMVKEYGATAVADADALVRAEIDVYAPCAMGDALTDEVVDVLTAKIVCGAANNQLSHPGIEKALADRGILYAPDYCVNSGGLIQVADELEGFSFERAEQRASKIYDTTKAVFELARTDAVTPAEAADRLAERRMRDVGRLRGLYLPR